MDSKRDRTSPGKLLDLSGAKAGNLETRSTLTFTQKALAIYQVQKYVYAMVVIGRSLWKQTRSNNDRESALWSNRTKYRLGTDARSRQ